MGRILDTVKSPADVRTLSIDELNVLAEELRHEIIRVVSRNGGHLAPSLGVVELTLALHHVFESPKDKIVWDVGHQSYAHKLLTGRRDAFETLRQYGGIAGFPRREESPHDAFNTGHSSTSISAALGMACARDHLGEQNRVIAVIGDGSLTAGLAFEGLNQAGHLKKNLMVVVNDNRMSISKNVGALSQYLTRLLSAPTYQRLESEIWDIMGKIPAVGERARELASRALEGIRGVFVPGLLFEELGFKYYGPLDGHNVELLVEAFERLRLTDGPLLVHVVTQKGRGYLPAEEDSSRFHGIGSFEKETGTLTGKPSAVSYTEIFGKTLVSLAESDERIVAITSAMPAGTGLSHFARRFPERFYDVGIAEQHAVTFAAGLASQGMKPVVAIYSSFLQRAYDQVVHDVCLQKLPVRFMIDRGGLVGDDGPTHHGVFDLTFLRAVPNLVVMAPKDENELAGMVRTAVEHEGGPIAVRYPRGAGLGVAMDYTPGLLELGRGEVLRRGDDLTILAVGSMVDTAVRAADTLETAGVRASVVNARFVKPLDRELILDEVGRTRAVITLEENVEAGGFGAAVLELLQREGLDDATVRIMALPDAFVTHGARGRLLADCGLTPDDVAAAARDIVTRRGRSLKEGVSQ
ncbi:MAG: 1-deoxy-D-xylulose-5-phosphate synthase [Candidatus Eisenbacteria bacterium]|nr:1-deoxy-D-xylulose-5-phosphate synthase [Candidatus Eisenbacteria bacterium]